MRSRSRPIATDGSGIAFHRSGKRQFHGGLDAGVEFIDRDPQLRDVRWFANPDPRPKAFSPALDKEPPQAHVEGAPAPGSEYIGAFGKEANWLKGWTVFGADSDFDPRNSEYGPWYTAPVHHKIDGTAPESP